MKYNTDVNIVGGIPDYYMIIKALPLILDDEPKLKKLLVTDNAFDLRTEESRNRFLRVLKSSFISENNQINTFVSSVIQYLSENEKDKFLMLFWIFSMNNRLFYEMNRDVYLKFYFQGRAELPMPEVLAYLKELVNQNPELKDRWSEKTIRTIASKYLTILKKFGLLEGGQKKSFNYVSVSDEMLALFVHLHKLREPQEKNLLEDEFFTFSFVSKETLLDRMKRLGKKGWINMNYTGTTLRAAGVFGPNEIIDGIFKRT